MEQVGWGKVDEAQLRRFLVLHSDNFDRMHRTPAIARLEASNMLFHIGRTLEQAVEQKPVTDAIGPSGSKLVLIVGHDTSIAPVAALLGLHWDLDARKDDTPPGTELAFELWQDDRGAYSVRVTVAMQTLRQLREVLAVPGCATGEGCRWQEFQGIASRAIDRDDVVTARSN